jgi:pimeloyl-ACP methyl ester carboxylesterase
MENSRSVARALPFVAIALLLGACASTSPVGITRVDTQTGYRVHSQNALSADRLSDASQTVLRRFGLLDRFDTDPAGVLTRLHTDVGASGEDDRLFALAELSLLYGMHTGDRARMLAAAIYSYALLFPGNGSAVTFHPSDPRVRLAYEIYNAGLAQGLMSPTAEHVQVEGGSHALPFGTLNLGVTDAALDWGGYRLEKFISTTTLETRGIRNRYRKPGLGASLAASLSPGKGLEEVAGARRIGPRMKVPVTLIMRVAEPRVSLAAGQVRGQLELHPAHEGSTVTIDGSVQPIEFDTSAALALQLEDNPLYDIELASFLRGGAVKRLLPENRAQDGIAILQPYRVGRIPLVLVHGTASSPARWAELINELQGDEAIMTRYQIWLFLYDSGNPIAFSAGRLRTALAATIDELDPQGKDQALRCMVVAGHSQGGLLTKLTVIDSGTRFWELLSTKPFDSIDVMPETRELLRQSVFFTPLPFVKRVIFIATPHHGALMAQGRIGAIAARLVRLPAGVVGQVGQAVAGSEEEALLAQVRRPANAVQNMNPRHRSIRALAAIPVATEVPAHSIIAVKGDGPFEDGNDGVVAYRSAHIEEAKSELIVRSKHSMQGNPQTIEEIRRILFEHSAVHADELR